MTREQIILELQQEYAARREENMRIYERRRSEACEKCPGLEQVLDARHAAVLQGVRTSLMNRFKKPGENAELPNAMVLMNQRIQELLREGGVMCLCLYCGKECGYEEKNRVLDYLKTVDSSRFTVCVADFVNRKGDFPIPVFIIKRT